MRKYFIISWALILTLFVSCSDDINEQTTSSTPFNQPNSEVRVYTEEEAKYVSEEAAENTLVFESNTPDNIIPQPGTIIQMPISENTPYGFLGKVTEVKKDNNIVVTASEVALDEAYPNLSLDSHLNILDGIEGVFDEEGNPVEYTIEGENAVQMRSMGTQTRAAAEYDWEKAKINIPIPTDLLGKEFSAQGSIKVSFAGSKFDLDNKDGLKYLNFEIHPSLALSAEITTEIKGGKKEFKTKPLEIKARAVVGPLIIPITIPIYFKAGIKGEFTSSLQLNYSKACKAYVRYKEGKWSHGCEPIKSSDESPWVVTSFDVNGSLYAGLDVEVIAGLYTRNVGIGFELYPNATLSASASLSSIDPFKVNPDVTFGIGLESRIFCKAMLFSKNLEVFDIKLPDATFFQRSVTMFPKISEFEAIGSSSSAEISYISDSRYFLNALGVKTGATVYKQDKATEVNTYYPAHNREDRFGNLYYNTNVSELQVGAKYFAAPIISWLNFKWVGDLQEFSTEAKYHLGFRCSNHSYDVISFDFDLNNKTGNVIDYTTEATDYDGSPMRVHITATYNSSSQTLNGIFDFYFYDDPGQQRKDGFTVSLATDDSGYVDCSKVVDNGGCYAALRIYKTSSTAAARTRYAAPLVDDDCNVGIFNKNYTK